MAEQISEREQALLRLLIEKFINDGQPVSSKLLAENLSNSLSPATIRNMMAELEERGYLKSLHTSSGRVPTSLGYRFFIDSLLTVKPLEQAIVEEFKHQLNPDQSTSHLIANASHLLSRLTQMAGLVTLPYMPKITLRHVEFLPLSNQRVLVILVMNEKEVQNRIIQTQAALSRQELEYAANFLNEHFAGKDIETIKKEITAILNQDHLQFKEILNSFMSVATDTLQLESTQNDFVMSGEYHLLASDTSVDLGRLKALFDAINQKRQVLHLLDQCLSAQSLKIFVGDESGYAIFDDVSMVSAPYSINGSVVGALGVIGPVRMDYERVIPIVEMSARLLSAAMGGESGIE